MEYNLNETGDKLTKVTEAMGVDTKNMTLKEGRLAAINAVKKLSKVVGILENFKDLGVKKEDIEKLTEYAMIDPCTPSNPRLSTKEDMMELYNKVF